MCESDNDNIRCYFHDWLCSLTSADIVWFLKDTLNILVLMVAVLWIYAVTLVKFIMDYEDLSQ